MFARQRLFFLPARYSIANATELRLFLRTKSCKTQDPISVNIASPSSVLHHLV